MPDEEQNLRDFFKNIVQGFGEMQATQALQKQADLVASTIGGHVREVLGPVSEATDVIKNTFQNTIGFMKGAMDDLGGFFGLDEKVEEKVYRAVSLDQGADIIEEGKISNELIISSSEQAYEMWKDQMKVFAAQYEISEEIVKEVADGFKVLFDQMDVSNDIAEKDLKQKHEERLEDMRAVEKKDKTLWQRVMELLIGVLLAPAAIIAGLVAGFATSFQKVLFAPLRLIRGIFAFFVPAIKEIFSLKGLTKALGKNKLLAVILKPFKMISGVFAILAKNRYLFGLFRMSRFIGSKILFPLFVLIDALTGLSKVKEIFGPKAGLREYVIGIVAGIWSGLLSMPAMALDWINKELFGIETDFAKYFDIESIAKAIDSVTKFFSTKIINPIKEWLTSPETEDKFNEFNEEMLKFNKALRSMLDKAIDFFKSTYQKIFGTEEERARRITEFEQKTPFQQQIELSEALPGEMDIGPQISQISAEEFAANKARTDAFIGYIKENTKGWEAIKVSLNAIAKAATGVDVLAAKETVTNIQNISTAIGGGGAGAGGGGYSPPREESLLPSLNLLNKVK